MRAHLPVLLAKVVPILTNLKWWIEILNPMTLINQISTCQNTIYSKMSSINQFQSVSKPVIPCGKQRETSSWENRFLGFPISTQKRCDPYLRVSYNSFLENPINIAYWLTQVLQTIRLSTQLFKNPKGNPQTTHSMSSKVSKPKNPGKVVTALLRSTWWICHTRSPNSRILRWWTRQKMMLLYSITPLTSLFKPNLKT